MKIFSGSSNPLLAEKIAHKLGTVVSPVDEHIFADGERRIRIADDVVGEHCLVIQSTNTPVDSNYMELFLLIDGLKRSGAEFVTAIMPYMGYQRQDHVFREGEAVSLEVMIRILESLETEDVISLDMHSIKIPDLFHIPVAHISALPLFAKQIEMLIDTQVKREEVVLVSPDKGGIARIEKLSSLLGGMEYVSLLKDRDLVTGDIVMREIDGDVSRKKVAIIVDDMVASGKTTVLAAEKLKEARIEKIYAFATHAIFASYAPELLEKSNIEKVFVTDTVEIPKEKQFSKLAILSVSDMIAQAIKGELAAR